MLIGGISVTYLYDPIRDYTDAVRAAENRSLLESAIEEYHPIASDALASVQAMTDADWPEWERFKIISQDDAYSGG